MYTTRIGPPNASEYLIMQILLRNPYPIPTVREFAKEIGKSVGVTQGYIAHLKELGYINTISGASRSCILTAEGKQYLKETVLPK